MTMIDIKQYLQIYREEDAKVCNVIDPKDFTRVGDLIPGELYFNIHTSCLLFRIAQIPGFRYSTLFICGSLGGYISEIHRIPMSQLEFSHNFHISKQKETLIRIMIPNFPVIETPNYDDYRSRRKGA